jgi:hypothetical protein
MFHLFFESSIMLPEEEHLSCFFKVKEGSSVSQKFEFQYKS